MGDVQVRYKASQSSHASRKMPRSPRLAHKAPVIHANKLLLHLTKKMSRTKTNYHPEKQAPWGFLAKYS